VNKEVNSMGSHSAVPKGCPYEAASLIIHGESSRTFASDLENVSHPGRRAGDADVMHQFMKKDEKTGKTTPHIIYGINMVEMLRLKPWWTVEGRFFTDNETNVMLVGKDLAEKENLSVDQILPVGPKKENFTIVGILTGLRPGRPVPFLPSKRSSAGIWQRGQGHYHRSQG
jgi:hypothetical protein